MHISFYDTLKRQINCNVSIFYSVCTVLNYTYARAHIPIIQAKDNHRWRFPRHRKSDEQAMLSHTRPHRAIVHRSIAAADDDDDGDDEEETDRPLSG